MNEKLIIRNIKFTGFSISVIFIYSIFIFSLNACEYEIQCDQSMLNIDLSDESVKSMTKLELWEIGANCLNWPREVNEGLSKNVIHQKLLDAKYASTGDFRDSDIKIQQEIEENYKLKQQNR